MKNLDENPKCRRCGKPAITWKGWEICDGEDGCGHRHHTASGWHDPIPAPGAGQEGAA